MKWWTLLALLALWQVTGFYLLAESHPPESLGTPGVAPKRIVSLAPNITEILFALGLAQEVIGVTDFSDYPEAARTKPKVGTFWSPNLESIVAAAPDLVVTLGFGMQVSLGRRLSRFNIRACALKIETLEQLLAGIGELGALTGRSSQALSLQQEMTRRLATLAHASESVQKVSVLWVIQREPLRVAGRDSLTQAFIERAGGTNAMGPTLHKYPPIGLEQALLARPDVIIEQTMTGADPATQLQEAKSYWTRFARIPAVREGRIYVIDGDTVSRLGPRLCDGIESVARCLHGPLFLGRR